MKKLIVCLLCLLMIASCAPAYAYNESLLYGTWTHFERSDDGEGFIECFTLTEDHKVFWFYQRFTESNDGFTRNYLGTWTFKNNEAYITTGNTAKIKGFITTEGQFAQELTGGYILFDKTMEKKPQETSEQNGVYVQSGYWEVGVDIPAGVYSVRKSDKTTSQNFIVYEKYNPESGRYTRTIINTILNERNPQIGKFTLYDGNIVWVGEGVYFDAPVSLGF